MKTIYSDGGATPEFLRTCVVMDGYDAIFKDNHPRPADMTTGELSEHAEWLAALQAARFGCSLGDERFNVIGDRKSVTDALSKKRPPKIVENLDIYNQIIKTLDGRAVGWTAIPRDFNYAGKPIQTAVDSAARKRQKARRAVSQ